MTETSETVKKCTMTVTTSVNVSGSTVNVTLSFLNHGAKPAFVLKSMFGESELDKPEFQITSDGQKIKYRGRFVKRAEPTLSDYQELAPGDTYVRKVRIDRSYGFLKGSHDYVLWYAMLAVDPVTKKLTECRSEPVTFRYDAQ